jgi:hypothetical protein
MQDAKTLRVYAMPLASLYRCYIEKARKKGRTEAEVQEILCWLFGYTVKALQKTLTQNPSLEVFLRQAPKPHPARLLVKGAICGVRIETIQDPLMREIRIMDKLIDELAKGKSMEKTLGKE